MFLRLRTKGLETSAGGLAITDIIKHALHAFKSRNCTVYLEWARQIRSASQLGELSLFRLYAKLEQSAEACE